MTKTDIISALSAFGTFGYGVYLCLVSGGEFTVTGLIKAGAALVIGFIFSCLSGWPLIKSGWTKLDKYFQDKADKIEEPKLPEVVIDVKETEKPVEIKIDNPIKNKDKIMVKDDNINNCLEALLEEFAENAQAVEHIKALNVIYFDKKVAKRTGDKVIKTNEKVS